MAALLASGANAETIKNAQTINRKIQGSRAAKQSAASTGTTPGTTGTTPTGGGNQVTTPTPPATGRTAPPINITPPVTISVSQQSFDNLVGHLSDLVNYVSQFPAYNQNEPTLKIAALNTWVTYLTTSNNNVKTAQVNLNNARATRTTVLYDKVTGLVQVAKEVKSYVKSVYGASSPQYKQINAIHFKTDVSTNHRKHLKK
jgi:hypothetical protein